MDDVSFGVFGLISSTFRCDLDLVTRDTQAEDIDGWDSLSHTVLLVGIEKHFGIRLDYEDVLDAENVGELIDHVAAAVAAKSAAGA